MDKRTEANWRKQLEFAYAQVDYWKEMAFANKEELEYYRGIVEEAVAKGAILVVDEDGNDLISPGNEDDIDYEALADASDFSLEDFLDEDIPLSPYDKKEDNKDED